MQPSPNPQVSLYSPTVLLIFVPRIDDMCTGQDVDLTQQSNANGNSIGNGDGNSNSNGNENGKRTKPPPQRGCEGYEKLTPTEKIGVR
jgi:hypothetical protein